MLGSAFASGCSLNLQPLGCFLPQNVHGLLVLKFPEALAIFHVFVAASLATSLEYFSVRFSGDGSRCLCTLEKSWSDGRLVVLGDGLRSTRGDGRLSIRGEGRRASLGESLRSYLGDSCLSTHGEGRLALPLDLPFELSRHLAVFVYSSSPDLGCFCVVRE